MLFFSSICIGVPLSIVVLDCTHDSCVFRWQQACNAMLTPRRAPIEIANNLLIVLVMTSLHRRSEIWLDRLGGDKGMGEFARKSMELGVENADVVIAVYGLWFLSMSYNFCCLWVEMIAAGKRVLLHVGFRKLTVW